MAYQSARPTSVATPIPMLQIKDSRIPVAEIHISNAASFHTARLQNLEHENEGRRFLRDHLPEATYVSDCYVDRIKKTGHLIRLNEELYALTSMDKHSVFYVSHKIEDFELIESISESIIIVDGQQVDTSTIQIGSYFEDKVMSRFGIKQEEVRPFFLDIITNGRYICVTHDNESKKPARLFCKDRKLAYVTLDFKAAITTYQAPGHGDNIHQTVTDKIADMLEKEIQEMNEKERKLSVSNKKAELENNVRIAKIELELFTQKDELITTTLLREKGDLLDQNRTLISEWESLVDDIRRHAIALSAFI